MNFPSDSCCMSFMVYFVEMGLVEVELRLRHVHIGLTGGYNARVESILFISSKSYNIFAE